LPTASCRKNPSPGRCEPEHPEASHWCDASARKTHAAVAEKNRGVWLWWRPEQFPILIVDRGGNAPAAGLPLLVGTGRKHCKLRCGHGRPYDFPTAPTRSTNPGGRALNLQTPIVNPGFSSWRTSGRHSSFNRDQRGAHLAGFSPNPGAKAVSISPRGLVFQKQLTRISSAIRKSILLGRAEPRPRFPFLDRSGEKTASRRRA